MIIKKNVPLDNGVVIEKCHLKVANISLINGKYKASFGFYANPEFDALQYGYVSGVYNGGNIEEQAEKDISDRFIDYDDLAL